MQLLDKVRGLTYALGFRPKLYTILHSPTRDLLYAGEAAVKICAAEIAKASADVQKAVAEIEGLSEPLKAVVKPEKVWLYETMKYCVVCGSELAVYVIDIKECPYNHGKTWITHNQQGLPVITFEPTEESDDN